MKLKSVCYKFDSMWSENTRSKFGESHGAVVDDYRLDQSTLAINFLS